MMNTTKQLQIVRNLVGEVSPELLSRMRAKVDMYLSPNLAIFAPSLDYCEYAITLQHTHPSHSFIYNFSGAENTNLRIAWDAIGANPC
jgi:AraC family transcriptional regulator